VPPCRQILLKAHAIGVAEGKSTPNIFTQELESIERVARQATAGSVDRPTPDEEHDGEG